MKKVPLLAVASLAVLGTVVGATRSSLAAAAAVAGHPLSFATNVAPCFVAGSSVGSIRNNCGFTVGWVLSSMVPTSGTRAATAVVSGAVTCFANAISRAGAIQSSTGSATGSGTNVTLNLGNVALPAFGSAVVQCNLAPQGELKTVNF
jgi:hypothetical protein